MEFHFDRVNYLTDE